MKKKYDMYMELKKLHDAKIEFNRAIAEILGERTDDIAIYDRGAIVVMFGEHKYKGEYKRCVKVSFTISGYYVDRLDNMTYQNLNVIAKRTSADDVVVDSECDENECYMVITLIYFDKESEEQKTTKKKSKKKSKKR